MEDHRNWMDASYKTYVCSLLDPWPYTLEKGKSFSQSVTSPSLANCEIKAKSLCRHYNRNPCRHEGPYSANRPRHTHGGSRGGSPGRGTYRCGEASGARLSDRWTEPGQEEAAANYRDLSRQTGAPVTLEIILPAKEPADQEVAAIASAVNAAGSHLHPLSSPRCTISNVSAQHARPWGPTYEEMRRRHEPRSRIPCLAVACSPISPN